MRVLPVLPLFGLSLCAHAADDAFTHGIRAILPPAQQAVAPTDVQAELRNAAPAAAPATAEPTAQPKQAELSFTPDTAPAADTSPAAHPSEYADFKAKLKTQAEKNLYDFCPAMETVLRATNDVFAAQAWMEKAAAEGLPAAQQYVADRKLQSIRKDQLQSPAMKEAYKLVRKAADAGYEPAMVNVYMCLKNGVGVAKSDKEAEKYMMNACKKGGFIPRFKWLQLSGKLTSFNDRNTPAVKGEIDRGNSHVVYFIAMLAPSLPEKVEWLQKAAKLGNPEALYQLSVIISSRDPKASFELLREAIKLHSADAMFTLGTVLTEGNPDSEVMKACGLQHDDVTGRHLIRIAAMTGSPAADYWLGRVTHDGVYGIAKDDKLAFRYLQAGSDAGDLSCTTAMGAMMLGGSGTKQDTRTALGYLNMAANQGSPQAVQLLACALYNGLGVPADRSKAEDTLQEAAAMNYPEAYVYLGYIATKAGDERMGQHWTELAAHDLGDRARELYDKLMAEGWKPEP